MALTNAERQKRHRDRIKEALRNATGAAAQPNEAPPLRNVDIRPARSLPALIADHIAATFTEDELGYAADIAAEAIDAVMRKIGDVSGTESPASAALVEALGGAQYLQALEARQVAEVAEKAKRVKDRQRIPPPPIPVT